MYILPTDKQLIETLPEDRRNFFVEVRRNFFGEAKAEAEALLEAILQVDSFFRKENLKKELEEQYREEGFQLQSQTIEEMAYREALEAVDIGTTEPTEFQLAEYARAFRGRYTSWNNFLRSQLSQSVADWEEVSPYIDLAAYSRQMEKRYLVVSGEPSEDASEVVFVFKC